MAVITIGNYCAEWMPSGKPGEAGCGWLVLRSATRFTELYFLNGLHPDDFRNL